MSLTSSLIELVCRETFSPRAVPIFLVFYVSSSWKGSVDSKGLAQSIW